nr:hypothetical protein [Klebsiella pneumoniae]
TATPETYTRPDTLSLRDALRSGPGYAESGRRAARQLIEQIAGSVDPRQIVIPAALN